jgi:hypothetical protein
LPLEAGHKALVSRTILGMRTPLIAAILFVVAAAVGLAADDTGVATSATLARTAFLSTEDAEATIITVNHTDKQITLDLGKIEYLTYSKGRWSSTYYCRRDCWRARVPISPGARSVVRVTLPSCEVLSDPCTETVSMKYPIQTAVGSRTYTVAFPTYRFVADPKAAYRNVPDGRAVFIAEGSTKTTVARSAILIGVTAAASSTFPASSPPASFFVDIAKTLSDSGIAVDRTTYEPDNLLWYHPLLSGGGEMRIQTFQKPDAWRAVFLVKDGARQSLIIDQAIQAVRQRFRTQVSKLTVGVTADFDTNPDVWKAAEAAAQRQADRLTEITRSGQLDWTKTERTTSALSVGNAEAAHYDPNAEIVFATLPALTPLEVNARVQMRYVGTQPANLAIAPAVAALAKQAFRSAGSAPTLAPAAQTADDRPELYATGDASERASLALGLDPYAVAILNARSRTHELATLLGVRPGPDLLFALYTEPSSGDPAIGVATTFIGNYAAQSNQIDADPHIRTFRAPSTSVINVPIEIPQRETTLTEATGAELPPASNVLRFEMELDTSGDSFPVDAGVIATRLRSAPGVIDAVATSAHSGVSVRFEVLLRRAHRPSLSVLAHSVLTEYSRFKPNTSFSLSPFVLDCRKFETQLMQATLRQDWLAAQRNAEVARVRLRKLLLVAISPIGEGSACYPLARDPGPLEYDTIDKIPSVLQPAPLSVSSMMVFRTMRIGLP